MQISVAKIISDSSFAQTVSSMQQLQHVYVCNSNEAVDLPHDDMPSAYSHQQTLKKKVNMKMLQ